MKGLKGLTPSSQGLELRGILGPGNPGQVSRPPGSLVSFLGPNLAIGCIASRRFITCLGLLGSSVRKGVFLFTDVLARHALVL